MSRHSDGTYLVIPGDLRDLADKGRFRISARIRMGVTSLVLTSLYGPRPRSHFFVSGMVAGEPHVFEQVRPVLMGSECSCVECHRRAQERMVAA